MNLRATAQGVDVVITIDATNRMLKVEGPGRSASIGLHPEIRVERSLGSFRVGNYEFGLDASISELDSTKAFFTHLRQVADLAGSNRPTLSLGASFRSEPRPANTPHRVALAHAHFARAERSAIVVKFVASAGLILAAIGSASLAFQNPDGLPGRFPFSLRYPYFWGGVAALLGSILFFLPYLMLSSYLRNRRTALVGTVEAVAYTGAVASLIGGLVIASRNPYRLGSDFALLDRYPNLVVGIGVAISGCFYSLANAGLAAYIKGRMTEEG